MIQTQSAGTFMTSHHTTLYMFSSRSSLFVTIKYEVSYAQAEGDSQPLVNTLSSAQIFKALMIES